MITFKQLYENKDVFLQLMQGIEEKCAPFVKDMGGMDNIMTLADHRPHNGLMRGIEATFDHGVGVKTVRNDRRPQDLSKTTHSIVDDWFFDQFGKRYRSNAAFCTNNYGQAKAYGRPHLVFPIGNYSACWSASSEDLLTELSREGLDFAYPSDREEFTPKIIDVLEDIGYEEGRITPKIIDKRGQKFSIGHEIMVSCDKYVLMDFENVELYNDYSR